MSARRSLRAEDSQTAPALSGRLRARRARARGRLGLSISMLACTILAALVWLCWQPYMRISSVTIYGADQSYADYARRAMGGTYLYIVPRNSAFFYPATAIRANILAAHPEVAAISIFREGVTALSIRVTNRVAIARWCGTTYSLPTTDTTCYVFDAGGYLYATTSAATSTVETLNDFAVFDPLVGNVTEPMRATLSRTAQLPATFTFARQVGALGSLVTAIAIRDDPPSQGYSGAGEVDEYLMSGTRLTYVLGGEQAAFAALVSAKGDYNLSDGSIDYLDLRFPGKIYLKKVDRVQ